jgi:hypothetical protein
MHAASATVWIWMAVVEAGVPPREAEFEPRARPADRCCRRLPANRTGFSTPLSEELLAFPPRSADSRLRAIDLIVV